MEPETVSREELRGRRISSEEKISELVDRANKFRTDVANPRRIEGWSETLEALADAVMPWATEEDRQAKLKKKRGQFFLEWEDRPVAVITTTTGRVIVPTAQDCREAHRILLSLLDRQGLLVSRRTVSGPAARDFKGGERQGESSMAVPHESEPTLLSKAVEEILEFESVQT